MTAIFSRRRLVIASLALVALMIAVGAWESSDRLQGQLTTGCQVISLPSIPTPGWVQSGDLDGDGDLDLVALTFNTSTSQAQVSAVVVYLNNGDRTFLAPVEILSQERYTDLALDDFDRDGDLDIALVINSVGPQIAVLRNNGDGSFDDSPSFSSINDGIFHREIATGDVNADGDPDLFVSGQNGGTVLFGGNGFSFAPGPVLGNGDGNLFNPRLIDIDRDGKLDAIATPGGSNDHTLMQVFNNLGGGNFQAPDDYERPQNPYTNSLWGGDVNGDGNIDLVQQPNGGDLFVWINDGDGTFTIRGSQQAIGRDGALADFTGDGILDLIGNNYVHTDYTFRQGNGDGTFKESVTLAAAKTGREMVAADFDGNGIMDFAQAMAESGDEVRVMFDVTMCIGVGGQQCPNGDIDAGEQCEIGYPCPTDYSCNASCRCVTQASSSAQPVSSLDTSSVAFSPFSSSSAFVPSSDSPVSSSDTDWGSSTAAESSMAAGCVREDEVGEVGVEQCCSGLDRKDIKVPDGNTCVLFDSSIFVCVDCGDGVCGPAENECICASDCGQAGDDDDSSGDDDSWGDDDSSGDDDDDSWGDDDSSGDDDSDDTSFVVPQCGDWELNPGEECEIGVACQTPGQSCDESRCVCEPVCHDPGRVKDSSEECETNDDCTALQYCDNQCLCRDRESYCGDGSVNQSGGEQCETDGDCSGDTVCNFNCRCVPAVSVCGNGVQEAEEECEAGVSCRNAAASCDVDECRCVALANFALTCGDGQVQPDEECEESWHCSQGEVCNKLSCTCVEAAADEQAPVCGDGELSPSEQCEWDHPCAVDGMLCDPMSCSCIGLAGARAVCGDGVREGEEECDLDDPCAQGRICNKALCICEEKIPRCGDGALDGSEQCEKGIACPDGSMCDMARCSCRVVAICGNNRLDQGEQCDDGNIHSGDGCSGNCMTEKLVASARCGDGRMQAGEGCDDGNRKSGDGCSSTCSLEHALPKEALSATVIELPFVKPVAKPIQPQPIPQVQTVTPLVITHQSSYPPATTNTGPAAVALIAAGAAAGYAFVRRRGR